MTETVESTQDATDVTGSMTSQPGLGPPEAETLHHHQRHRDLANEPKLQSFADMLPGSTRLLPTPVEGTNSTRS